MSIGQSSSPVSRTPDRYELDATRYAAVSRVLLRVLFLNVAVALAKVAYGYATGMVSILSDGFHSLADGASSIVAMIGIAIARKPPDSDHPYGHRKYETLAAGMIFAFLLVVLVQVSRAALGRLSGNVSPQVTGVSFTVMLFTLAVNMFVVWYERREAMRLGSEVLLADALHTRSDVLTSLAVMAALIGMRMGYSILDPVAALVVSAFIGKAGYDIARETSKILTDRMVIAEDDLYKVVMSVPGVLGCHNIRTRGSADHVFLDLHIWLDPAVRLDIAHSVSHVVKDELTGRYPQIMDAIIHIEPPPIETNVKTATRPTWSRGKEAGRSGAIDNLKNA